MRFLLSAFLLALAVTAASAQDSTGRTYKHNRLLVDVGVQLPQGDDATGLGMHAGVGFNLTFWQLFDDRFVTLLSVGSATMQLGGSVQTDSGMRDLSNYSASMVPLMGGIGYVFTGMPVIPFVCAEAGVSFMTLNAGSSRPVAGFNNEAYFSYGGRLGVAYPVSNNIAIQLNGRFIKIGSEQLSTIGVNGGIAWSF